MHILTEYVIIDKHMKKDEYCRVQTCKRKLNSRNRLKSARMCKKCGRIYRSELAAKKVLNNTNKFLEAHPDVRMIEGFTDKYMVSDRGKIYRVTVTGVKELKPTVDKSGYHSISLFNEGKRKTLKVHRLVAKAWIPNPYPYVNKIINHKDGHKLNNYFENLEWCTYKQNSRHAVKTGLIPVGEANSNSKLTEADIIEICKAKGRVTQKDLAEKFGVSKKMIILIQQKKVWKHVKRPRIRRRLLLNRRKKQQTGEII